MKHNRIFMSVAMATIVLVSLCAVGASTLSVSAAQGSSNAQAPPIVGAPVGAGAPGVCSQNGVGLDLFIRGADNALYWKHSPDGTTWTAPETLLGGGLTSAPAATSPKDGVIEVFVRGTSGALYEMKITNANTVTPSWTWSNIGGGLLTNTGPSACSWVSSTIIHTEVFVTGTNNRCYYIAQTGNAPYGLWTNLGGYLTSAPAATALSDGSQIGLFVAGTNSNIYYDHFINSKWTGWVGVGGQLLKGTSPAAYNWGSSHIGWFVTGTNGVLYHNWKSSSGYSGYENLGGVLTSSPSATAKVSQVIDVFARGSTGEFAALYQISYGYPPNTGSWGAWTAIGGV